MFQFIPFNYDIGKVIITIPILMPLISAILLSVIKNFRLQKAITLLVLACIISTSLYIFLGLEDDLLIASLDGRIIPLGLSILADRFIMLSLIVFSSLMFYTIITDEYSSDILSNQLSNSNFIFNANLVILFSNIWLLSYDLILTYLAIEFLFISVILMIIDINKLRSNFNILDFRAFIVVQLIGSILFFISILMLYRFLYTTHFADIALRMANLVSLGTIVQSISISFFIFLLVKLSIFSFSSSWVRLISSISNKERSILLNILSFLVLVFIIRLYTVVLVTDFGVLIQNILKVISMSVMFISSVLIIGKSKTLSHNNIMAYIHIHISALVLFAISYFSIVSMSIASFILFSYALITHVLILTSGSYKYRFINSFLWLSIVGISPIVGIWARIAMLQINLAGSNYILAFFVIFELFLFTYALIHYWILNNTRASKMQTTKVFYKNSIIMNIIAVKNIFNFRNIVQGVIFVFILSLSINTNNTLSFFYSIVEPLEDNTKYVDSWRNFNTDITDGLNSNSVEP